jgi:hypothetical protein
LDDDLVFSFFDRQGADSLVRSFVRSFVLSSSLVSLSNTLAKEVLLSTLKIFFFYILSLLSLSLFPGEKKKALLFARVFVFAHREDLKRKRSAQYGGENGGRIGSD